MSETPKLGLPLVASHQAQKHVIVNEAFTRLDALSQLRIEATGVVTPPVAPNPGDVFAVGAGATGDWVGRDGQLAVSQNGGWAFVMPRDGWDAYLADLGSRGLFNGTTWVAGAGSVGASGAGFVHRTLEFEHDLGTGITSSIVGALPAMTIVYGITGRVTATIGGTSSLSVGVTGSPDRYGAGIGASQGSWLRGITGQPQAYYADEDIVLTAQDGGSFDGSGRLLLAVHLAELTLPGE